MKNIHNLSFVYVEKLVYARFWNQRKLKNIAKSFLCQTLFEHIFVSSFDWLLFHSSLFRFVRCSSPLWTYVYILTVHSERENEKGTSKCTRHMVEIPATKKTIRICTSVQVRRCWKGVRCNLQTLTVASRSWTKDFSAILTNDVLKKFTDSFHGSKIRCLSDQTFVNDSEFIRQPEKF